MGRAPTSGDDVDAGARGAQEEARAPVPLSSGDAVDDGGRHRIVLVLVLTFLQRATNNMQQTMLPLLAHYTLHLAAHTVGLLATVFTAAMIGATTLIAARIPTAAIERAVLLSTLALLLTLPLYGMVHTAGQLAILVAAGGAASGVIFPFLLTLASASAPPAVRERAVALYALTLSLSLVGGPLLQGLLLDLTHNNLGAVYRVFTVALAGSLVVLWRLERTRRGGLPVVGRPSRQEHAAAVPVRVRLRRLAGRPAYRLGFVGNLTYVVPFAALIAFGGVFAHEVYGASYERIQLLFAAFFLTSFLARLAVVLTAPIRRKGVVFGVAVLLTLGGLVLLGAGHALPLFVLGCLVLGIPHGLTYPLSAALIADGVAPDEVGFANVVFSAASNIVGFLVPPAVGLLAGRWGYPTTFLALAAPVAILAAALLPGHGQAPRLRQPAVGAGTAGPAGPAGEGPR